MSQSVAVLRLQDIVANHICTPGSMLEDPSIQNLISWTATGDSFVMQPSADFSKVLACVVFESVIVSFWTVSSDVGQTIL